ncbi:MAG: HD domain-containing protein [Oscillospiraceae bacterium]|nr:HD domain-containing protein [Oscillospiraceae bacterium]
MELHELAKRMIDESKGNLHDIDHLLRVWSFARLIGQQGGLEPETQYLLEAAALTHDIACPYCRERYGNTNGKHQEREGERLIRKFLAGTDMLPDCVERIVYLVGHHHTYSDVCGMDHQILLEAGFIANAIENGYSRKKVSAFFQKICRTASGRLLMESLFQMCED